MRARVGRHDALSRQSGQLTVTKNLSLDSANTNNNGRCNADVTHRRDGGSYSERIDLKIASEIPEMTSHPNEREQELAALARLVASARDSAEEIGFEKVAASLNIALVALLDEIGEQARPDIALAPQNDHIPN